MFEKLQRAYIHRMANKAATELAGENLGGFWGVVWEGLCRSDLLAMCVTWKDFCGMLVKYCSCNLVLYHCRHVQGAKWTVNCFEWECWCLFKKKNQKTNKTLNNLPNEEWLTEKRMCLALRSWQFCFTINNVSEQKYIFVVKTRMSLKWQWLLWKKNKSS